MGCVHLWCNVSQRPPSYVTFKVVSPIVTKKLSINFPPYQTCNLFPDGQTCATSYTIHTTTVFQSGRLAVFVSLFSSKFWGFPHVRNSLLFSRRLYERSPFLIHSTFFHSPRNQAWPHHSCAITDSAFLLNSTEIESMIKDETKKFSIFLLLKQQRSDKL